MPHVKHIGDAYMFGNSGFATPYPDASDVLLSVPLTGGRIGRKVLLGVLSRGHEIASVERPAYGLFEKGIGLARYGESLHH